MKPWVSIVIVNWNGKKFIKGCLDSALNQSYQAYEIILVDNASTDDSVNFVYQNYQEEIKKKRLKIIVNEKNYGFAEGNNIGIHAALEDPHVKYIGVLNIDTIAERTWLRKLVIAGEKNPKIGMCQGKILLMDKKRIDSTGLLFYPSVTWWDRGEGEIDGRQYDLKTEIFGVCAAAALYKVKMLQEVQLNGEFFDRDFFGYCEDIELSLRGRLRGWQAVYVPDAVVFHERGGITGPETDFQIYHTQRNHLLLTFKSLPTRFLVKNLPLVLLAQMGSLGVYARRRKLHVCLKAKVDALRMFKKMYLKKISFFKKETQGLEKWTQRSIFPQRKP